MVFGPVIDDVCKYLAACWEVAITVRQRSKATMGLVAALLALPIVSAFGGKLEATDTGLYWIAVWLTTSAIVLIFIVSPFFVWRSQTGKLAALANKHTESVPVRDVWYKDAVFFLVHGNWPAKDEPIAAPFRKGGSQWSDGESKEFLREASRILRNLKQYAFDGIFNVSGKPRNLMTIGGDVGRHGVIEPIVKSHWRDYEVGISTMILDPEHVETSKDGLLPDRQSFVALKVSKRETEQLRDLLRKDPIFGSQS
jgi:hypothetical protein